MIVSLFRPGFYAAEHDPAVPTVIFDGDTVRDATPAALLRGVQVGGGLADAKAILREDGQYVAVDMAQARRRASTWWRALLAYSDLIVVRSPAEALVDLRAHPDPREVAGEMARAVRGRNSHRSRRRCPRRGRCSSSKAAPGDDRRPASLSRSSPGRRVGHESPGAPP
ncbi:MAG TPA: hypothetical protein PLB31_12370, partial [Fimbriimonadaceae bacterium]|nr:hypothetical protein [Fimbriimonadaceae bacterium]